MGNLSIGMALASYERTLVSGDSPFDRWYFDQDKIALGESAQRGLTLFLGKARGTGGTAGPFLVFAAWISFLSDFESHEHTPHRLTI